MLAENTWADSEQVMHKSNRYRPLVACCSTRNTTRLKNNINLDGKLKYQTIIYYLGYNIYIVILEEMADGCTTLEPVSISTLSYDPTEGV